jgi:hypothetical protein
LNDSKQHPKNEICLSIFSSVMDGTSWNKMKSLYLTIQIGLYEPTNRFKRRIQTHWKFLKEDFFFFIQSDIKKKPSPVEAEKIFDFKARALLKDLEHHIISNNLYDMYNESPDINNLKLTHSMMCSVIQHWEEQSSKDKILDYNRILTNPNVHILDQGIKRLSDLLTIAYQDYGKWSLELHIQNWDKEGSNREKDIDERIFDMVFLSRIIKKTELPDQTVQSEDQLGSSKRRKTMDSSQIHSFFFNLLMKMSPHKKQKLNDLNKSGSILNHLDKHFNHQPSLELDHNVFDSATASPISDSKITSHINMQSDIIESHLDNLHKDENKSVSEKLNDIKSLLKNPMDYCRSLSHCPSP